MPLRPTGTLTKQLDLSGLLSFVNNASPSKCMLMILYSPQCSHCVPKYSMFEKLTEKWDHSEIYESCDLGFICYDKTDNSSSAQRFRKYMSDHVNLLFKNNQTSLYFPAFLLHHIDKKTVTILNDDPDFQSILGNLNDDTFQQIIQYLHRTFFSKSSSLANAKPVRTPTAVAGAMNDSQSKTSERKMRSSKRRKRSSRHSKERTSPLQSPQRSVSPHGSQLAQHSQVHLDNEEPIESRDGQKLKSNGGYSTRGKRSAKREIRDMKQYFDRYLNKLEAIHVLTLNGIRNIEGALQNKDERLFVNTNIDHNKTYENRIIVDMNQSKGGKKSKRLF